jgi:hypothetical protein
MYILIRIETLGSALFGTDNWSKRYLLLLPHISVIVNRLCSHLYSCSPLNPVFFNICHFVDMPKLCSLFQLMMFIWRNIEYWEDRRLNGLPIISNYFVREGVSGSKKSPIFTWNNKISSFFKSWKLNKVLTSISIISQIKYRDSTDLN